MYLLAQDKNNLIEFNRLEYTKLFGTHTLTAYTAGATNYACVGSYESEEQARAEFNRIMEALRSGQTTIYEVR